MPIPHSVKPQPFSRSLAAFMQWEVSGASTESYPTLSNVHPDDSGPKVMHRLRCGLAY
jgi:hypothetical protein